jgi:N-acetylmuramoyl-L-alanine amidase
MLFLLKKKLLLFFLLLILVGSTFGSPVFVRDLKGWQEGGCIKLVIFLDKEVSYKIGFLKEDPLQKRPPRLYIDLTPARISKGVSRFLELGLKGHKVRMGQFNATTVRVVVEGLNVRDHKVFKLESPFRFQIELYEEESTPSQRIQPLTLVIDPGHGGKDPGAIGPTGLKEKDVVLKVAKILREKVKSRLGWRVVLTREGDEFLPLEKRTEIANKVGGDLFLSIHCNASYNRFQKGVETYFLSFTTDREALRLAARENGVPPSQIDALQLILYDLMLRAKVDESETLASSVQASLIGSLNNPHSQTHDLGVKRAPFIVLVGAKMPSILVEISFISNPEEERRLKDDSYLEKIAEGILQGLENYAKTYLTPKLFTRGQSN